MNRIFKIRKPYRVPDGTLVCPFLNPKDTYSGLPFDLFDGFSIAAGKVEAATRSKIHIAPFVTQVTFVRKGQLQVKMKSDEDEAPYTLWIRTGQAVLTERATLLQLINDGEEPCQVLYIVSPAYVFDVEDDEVLYDDSVALEEDWGQLEATGWRISKRLPTLEARQEAQRRLAGESR